MHFATAAVVVVAAVAASCDVSTGVDVSDGGCSDILSEESRREDTNTYVQYLLQRQPEQRTEGWDLCNSLCQRRTFESVRCILHTRLLTTVAFTSSSCRQRRFLVDRDTYLKIKVRKSE